MALFFHQISLFSINSLPLIFTVFKQCSPCLPWQIKNKPLSLSLNLSLFIYLFSFFFTLQFFYRFKFMSFSFLSLPLRKLTSLYFSFVVRKYSRYLYVFSKTKFAHRLFQYTIYITFSIESSCDAAKQL